MSENTAKKRVLGRRYLAVRRCGAPPANSKCVTADAIPSRREPRSSIANLRGAAKFRYSFKTRAGPTKPGQGSGCLQVPTCPSLEPTMLTRNGHHQRAADVFRSQHLWCCPSTGKYPLQPRSPALLAAKAHPPRDLHAHAPLGLCHNPFAKARITLFDSIYCVKASLTVC